MLNKNDIIQLNITSVTSDGDGVARTADGIVVFVPNTAPGDVIKALVLKVKKNVAFAKVQSIVTPCADRVTPDCPVSARCGGCVYRHISYEAELGIKRQKVIDAVTRIGGLSAELVGGIVPSPKVDCYRNKAMIPVGLDQRGEVVMGFYSRHSHRIAPCIDCRLSPDIFNQIAAVFYAFISRRPGLVYTPENRRGIRHLYLRYAESSGDVMVCIVAGSGDFEDSGELYGELLRRFHQIKSLLININPDDTNVILGKETRVISGCECITDTLCGLRFELAAPAFYQVNRRGAERLYGIAKEYAGLSGGQVLLDLYCGAGTIGLSMAGECRNVIGVEIVPEAVENAGRNAANNGISNARFICSDAAQAAENLREEGITPDVVIVDPPRKGLTPELIATVSGMAPARVVYVSCDPATLARDLKIFADYHYSVKEITPVDMFPRTAHVESVVMMSNKQLL